MGQHVKKNLLREIKGVDYQSHDLSRESSYFKDCKNLELSYNKGLRGRLGYRQIWEDLGFNSIYRHFYLDMDGVEKEELLFCNGHLWRYSETAFRVGIPNGVVPSLSFDKDKELVSTLPNGEVIKRPQLTLTIGAAKFGLSEYSMGSLWEALSAAGFPILVPPGRSQVCNWAKLTSIISSPLSQIATLEVSSTSYRDLKVNDIVGAWVSSGSGNTFSRVYMPAVVAYEPTATSVSLRFPYSVNGTNLRKVELGYCGILGIRADSILRISTILPGSFWVFFAFPSPIPSVTHFKQIQEIAVGSSDHSLVSERGEPSFLTTADSCFISNTISVDAYTNGVPS